MKNIISATTGRLFVMTLALALAASVALAQYRVGGVNFIDPNYQVWSALYQMQDRIIQLEDALRQEIRAREDLQKEVDKLKKEKPVAKNGK